MRVCVCHATKGFEYGSELYAPIRASALDAEHEFLLPHEAGAGSHTKARIESCDLVLAEVSYPSTGTGIELGWADAAGVPVACVYREGSDPSGALKHVAKAMVAYDGPRDLERAVREALDGAR